MSAPEHIDRPRADDHDRSARRRLTGTIAQLAAMLAAVVVVAVLLSQRGDELARITELGALPLALASVTTLVNWVLNGVQLNRLITRFETVISQFETWLLVMAGYALNHLPMKAGTVAQSVALRARWGVRITHFVALSAASQLVSLWSAATLAGVFALVSGALPALAWLLVLGPSAALATLVLWGRSHERSGAQDGQGRWAARLSSAVDGLSELLTDGTTMAVLVLVNLSSVTLVSARLFVIFGALGSPIGFEQAMLIGALTMVANILGVVPAGVGFREGGIVAGAALAGADPSVALAVAVVDRGVDVLWVLLAGVPSAVWLGRVSPRTR